MRPRPLPPLERVREVLDYDPTTGQFTWKVNRRGTARAGSFAGVWNKYLRIPIDNIKYPANRLAWYLITGIDPGESVVDHRDGDVTNNIFSNLRLATNFQNGWNRKVSCNNKLGLKGVSFNRQKGKFVAAIMVERRRLFLGYFDTPSEASDAYQSAVIKYHGKFARFD
jgi:HNH endonuclease